MNCGEIRYTVRCDVLTRIAHLIDQLFLDTRNHDPPARAFVFGDNKSPVGRRFDDGETHVGKVRNAAPLKLAIAARRLGAALDNVPRNGSRGEPVPVVLGPVKLVNQRCECESGVCCTASDDDMCAGL